MSQPLSQEEVERRSAERARMLCLVSVVDPESNAPIGFVIDLSEGGFCLLSKNPHLPGSSHRVKLLLALDEDDSQSVELDAECRWSRPSKDPNYSKSGFEFTSTSPEAPELVRRALSLVADTGI